MNTDNMKKVLVGISEFRPLDAKTFTTVECDKLSDKTFYRNFNLRVVLTLVFKPDFKEIPILTFHAHEIKLRTNEVSDKDKPTDWMLVLRYPKVYRNSLQVKTGKTGWCNVTEIPEEYKSMFTFTTDTTNRISAIEIPLKEIFTMSVNRDNYMTPEKPDDEAGFERISYHNVLMSNDEIEKWKEDVQNPLPFVEVNI